MKKQKQTKKETGFGHNKKLFSGQVYIYFAFSFASENENPFGEN